MELWPAVFDPRGYFFWLLLVSALVAGLERLRPWRPQQRALRQGLGQDVFWLVFNGHHAPIAIATLAGMTLMRIPGLEHARDLALVATAPLWLQFLVLFLIKDFCEWCVHNLLHRLPWLWRFHKVHHTIRELDWIGSFRFHWMEIVVYRSLTWLPLVVLGADARVVLVLAVLTTLGGHLNHANLDLTWGPLRYVFNSPRMHVWHHDAHWPAEHARGANFAIALSLWDWLFGTAWWPSEEEAPSQQPDELGFPGLERFPTSLLARLGLPRGK